MNAFKKLCAVFVLSAPIALPAAELPSGPYVTQSMIEQGVARFALPDRGTFVIEEIERPAGAATECHVSLKAVAASIENSIATGEFELALGKRKTVWLKKYVLSDGHLLCDGPGSDCKVKIRTTSIETPEFEQP
jgi:hypothetical protein